MKIKTSCFVLLFILTANSFFAYSQKYTIKESETIYPDYFHNFFRLNTNPRQYVVVNFEGTHGAFGPKRAQINMVAIYNDQLKLVSTNTVNGLDEKKYITGISSGNNLFIFSNDDRMNVYKCGLNPENGSAHGSTEKLFSFTEEYYKFFYGASPDSSYYYLVCMNHDRKSKDQKYDGVILDKQMNVFNKFSFVISDLREYIATTNFALSNKGILNVISAVRVKTNKSDYTPVDYILTHVDNKGSSYNKILSDIPAGFFGDITWQAKDDGLAFTGLLSKSKKDGFSEILCGSFDEQKQKIVDIKDISINKFSSLQNATQKFAKEIVKDGISNNADLDASYTLKDGSLIMILEEGNINQFIYDGTFNNENSYSGNVYVVKINARKELEWLKIITKNQIEPEGKIFTGIATMKDDNDGIHIFFHDYSKNENAESDSKPDRATIQGKFKNIDLASVYISKDGKVSKQFLLNGRESELHLTTTNFLSLTNEIIFTSYDRKNLGRSQYRIGLISLK
jgi:hypothetical protein